RRHTRFSRDWSSDVCSSDLTAMDRLPVEGRRILEAGCGIGLASLVLQRRGADVVASDIHPLAEAFLAYNSALNELPAVHYRQLRSEERRVGKEGRARRAPDS